MKGLKTCLLSVVVIGCVSSLAFGDELVDRIVAVVNRKVITLYQVQQAEQELLAKNALSRDTAPEERQKNIIEYLVENELVRQAAQESGILVSSEDIQLALEDIKQRNNIASDEQLRDIITRQEGKTWEEFLDEFREQIKTARLINREVRSKVDVSAAEVEAYYQEHAEQFEQVPATFHVRHVLLAVPEGASESTVQEIRAQAEHVAREIRSGADFQEMAVQYSDHPSAQNGGELGQFQEGELAAPFDIAFELDAGDVSDPVRSDLGFHLIYLEEKTGGAEATFEQVQPRIRQKLFEEKSNELYQEWLAKLKDQAYIEMK